MFDIVMMNSFHPMAAHLFIVFSLLNVAFARNHGALSSEEIHWKSKFPNTPMPEALKNLLPPPPSGSNKKFKSNDAPINPFIIYENIGQSKESNGVNAPINPFIIYEKHSKGSSTKSRDNDAPINPFIIYENAEENEESRGVNAPVNPFIIYESTDKNKEPKGVNAPINPFIIYGKQSKGSNIEFQDKDAPINPFVIYHNIDKSKELEGVNAPINPFIIYENRDKAKKSKGVNAPINPFIIYEKQSKGNKNSLGRKHGNASMNETIYFFQEDLRPGKMVKLPLVVKPRDFTTFLPQQVAQSIPFSSDNFPEILKHFSFGSDSTEADAMKQTIKGCERRAMRGEQMFCATSFDSFVDLSVSKLGKNIQLLASELGKETSNPMFTIGRGIQNMGEEELVCHKMMYPYAVFLCHSIEGTVVYKVTLVGTDRMKANAVAICHKDTSAWSPDHPAFFILNVKPGTIPICHFVVRDTLVWVRK